jgi:ATP-binding cassette, subfamily B, bacterial PglK
VIGEATSALDTDTKQEIVAKIKRLKGSKTIIVVAHCLSTLNHCDRIYRLDKGIMIEQGTYKQERLIIF